MVNIPWNKGLKGVQVAWNKGLTKKTDDRLIYERPTSFKKGRTTWNKDTKGLTKPNKTSFKKGSIPPFKGKHIPLEMRKRISMSLTGCSEFTGFRKTEAMRIRRSEEYKKWRTKIFERDNFTCQITGIIGGELVVHHLEGFNINKELRLNINNGITLNRKTHIEFHKQYGYKDNTLKQFIEFREGKTCQN